MNYRYMLRPIALIFDNDIEFCNLAKRILGTLDIDLISINAKENIEETINKYNPSILIVDIDLSEDLEGLGLIEKIRQLGIKIPLFVVSSITDMQIIKKALDFGATDYFEKPVDREVLQNKLSYYLKNLIPIDSKRPYFSLSGGAYSVYLQFGEKIISIDEFGLVFESFHLIPKATLVKISGRIIQNIFGIEKVLTSIVSSTANPETRIYSYYAEFEDLSEENHNNIRKWLIAKKTEDVA